MTIPGRLVLLGHPVSHSLSPRFQQAALDAAGIPLRYEALDVSPGALDDVLGSLIASSAAGNVTIPHKEAVFRACAERSLLAERVGAVNAFLVRDGRLVGHNTDVGGFDAAVRREFGDMSGVRVAVLGAGGGAAAVLATVEQWPQARAVIASRHPFRATALATRFSAVAIAAASFADAVHGADLVVNATPVGLKDDHQPVPVAELPGTAKVFDLVYRSGLTSWVRAARARGLRAADGLGMLVEQGALAFEFWFGVTPDRDAMWSAIS